MSNTEVRLSNKEKWQLLFIALLPVALFFVMTFNYFCCLQGNKYNQETLGQLGDFYGGIINPFITYLGLSAIVYGLKYNKKLMDHNIALEKDSKDKHMQLMAQSNAVAYLNAFEYSLGHCRNNEQDKVENAKLNIFKNYKNPENNEFRGAISFIEEHWGAAARYLSLIMNLQNTFSIGSSILDAAIAQLKYEEFEYVLICFSRINIDSAMQLVENKEIRVTKSIPEVLIAISSI